MHAISYRTINVIKLKQNCIIREFYLCFIMASKMGTCEVLMACFGSKSFTIPISASKYSDFAGSAMPVELIPALQLDRRWKTTTIEGADREGRDSGVDEDMQILGITN